MNNLIRKPFSRQPQPQSAARIRITRRGDEYLLRFQAEDFVFSELVGEFKFTVSPEHRTFDGEHKCWIVQAAAEAELEEFITMAEDRYGALVYRPGPAPNDKAVIQ